MLAFDPLMPIPLVVLYTSISFATLILCSLSLVAISRTKKTPYATKLLSVTLLTYDILFLILSCVCKLFDYSDIYVVSHMARGFQIAAQMVVGAMALERLFVLNWPYVYLRVVTGRVIRCACCVLFLFTFTQFYGIRAVMCYLRNKAINCGLTYSVYFILVSTLIPGISFISYIKIYRIIRNSGRQLQLKQTIRQYKGTIASFLVLINATVTQLLCLAFSLLYFARNSNGIKESGLVATLADWGNLLNCIVDPLIYVIWFRETRMELLKLVQGMCPWVKPKIEMMRNEIYHLPTEENISESCKV